MSSIGSVHVVEKFDASKSVALDGCRLSKVGYKLTSKQEKAGMKRKESKCVSLPKIAGLSPEFLVSAQNHIVSWFEEQQDKIVKNLVESGTSSIASSDIGEDAVLNWLNQESESARLTKDKIVTWFVSELQDQLIVVFGEKIAGKDAKELTTNQQMMVDKTVDMYKNKLASLSSGATKYEDKIVENLLKALEYTEEEDEIAGRLVTRLQGMMQADKEVLLSL